jgi:hypothetical protein
MIKATIFEMVLQLSDLPDMEGSYSSSFLLLIMD